MIKKIDYAIGVLAGFLTGVFAVPTVYNLGIHKQFVLMLLPLVFIAAAVLGLWIVQLASRLFPALAQFGKFVLIGVLNTAIDFGILNILSLATGITGGYSIGGVNVPGFVVAVINSYFWNKYWIFANGAQSSQESLWQNFSKFLGVSIIGLLLNSGIIIIITVLPAVKTSLAPGTALNTAKLLATMVVLFWNFFGYKFFVFKAHKASPSAV